MSECILDVYRRLLEAHSVPFEPIGAPDDWHVSLFVAPSFEPEVIYDIDHRAGRTLLYRSRFTSSLWEAVYEARQQKGKVQPVSIERACAELPADASLVQLIRGEHLFRLNDRNTLGCDGTTHTLVHVFSGGARRISAWEAQDEQGWTLLLTAIDDAVMRLPQNR